jgi:hypothetical protein
VRVAVADVDPDNHADADADPDGTDRCVADGVGGVATTVELTAGEPFTIGARS